MSDMTIDKGDILFNLKRSHKSFYVEYFCILVVLSLLVFGISKDFGGKLFIYGLSGLMIFGLISTGFHRSYWRYIITPKKMTFVSGIIKKHHKHIYFHPLGFVPDINVKQDWLQRFLNYGTVSVKVSNDHFKLKDIDHPHFIMKEIEELIHGARDS